MDINLLYRPSQTIAQCWLDDGESLIAEAGAMMGMSTNVHIQTQSGGMMDGVKRMLGGESFFRNTFTAQGGQGEVLLTTPLAGDMNLLEIGAQQWQLARSAFIACGAAVQIHPQATGRGFLAGVGPFVFHTQGQGQLLVGGVGALERLVVDGAMVIDTGHIVAWDAALNYTIERASPSGWLASFLSGEGLVCRFHGRGVVLVQSRNPQEYGRAIGRLLPAGGG